MYNLLKFCDSWVLLFLSVLKAASYTLGKVALQLTNWRKNTHTCIFPNHNSTEPYRNVLYLQSTFTNISLALFLFLSSFASWDLLPTAPSFSSVSACLPLCGPPITTNLISLNVFVPESITTVLKRR